MRQTGARFAAWRALRRLPCVGASLAALAVLLSPVAKAQDSTFQTTLGPAVLCLSDLDPAYFHSYLSAIKPAYKREHGAYWFRIAQPLFGAALSEVFVSDGSTGELFIGVVSSLPPGQLVAALTQAGAASFKPVAPGEKYSRYRSAGGAEIVFSGQRAKLFCRRDRPVG